MYQKLCQLVPAFVTFVVLSLGNGSYKKVCGFRTFVHIMWKDTKLHREFTSDVQSNKKIFVTFYHLITKKKICDNVQIIDLGLFTNNRFVTIH